MSGAIFWVVPSGSGLLRNLAKYEAMIKPASNISQWFPSVIYCDLEMLS